MRDFVKRNWFKLSIVAVAIIFFVLLEYQNQGTNIHSRAQFRALSEQKLIDNWKKEEFFNLKGNLKCKIDYSTDSRKEGKEFLLSNLFAPVLTKLNNTGADNFAGGYVITQTQSENHFENYFTKIAESEETITMHYETIFGGIATLILNKKDGLFADSFIGVMGGSPMGYISFGFCE